MQPSGSYGFTANSPGAASDAQCPPIPSDSPLYGSKLYPIALSAVSTVTHVNSNLKTGTYLLVVLDSEA